MAKTATSADILRIARDIYHFLNEGELERILTHMTDDAEMVDVPFHQTHTGRADILNFLRGLRTTFPDLTVEVTNQILCGTVVVNEFICRATHGGPMTTPKGDVSPTGRRVEFPLCEVWQFRGRKVASVHIYHDNLTLMRQLGLVGESIEPARMPSERDR